MSGYLPDYSMSVRAAQAYDEGEKPLSKWRKADILSAALKILSDSDLSEQEKKDRYSYLEKLPLNRLKGYLIQSSWHHTSSKYNETNFYYLDEEVLTDEDPKNFYDYEGNQEILDRLDKTTKDDRHYYALVSYKEFGGTKRWTKVNTIETFAEIVGDWAYCGLNRIRKRYSGNYFYVDRIIDEKEYKRLVKEEKKKTEVRLAELEAIRTETVKKEKEEKNKALEKERLKAIEYKDYVVPEGVSIIPNKAYLNNRYMESVILPSTLTKIGKEAFKECRKLSYVEFNSDIPVLPASLFYGCSLLQNIVLPVNLKHIYWNAFAYCNSLKTITLPEGLETIKGNAFYSCKSLATVRFPETLQSIDNAAFLFTSLKEVVLPKGVVLGDNVFPTDTKIVISENRIRNIPDLINGLSIFG
jgi:hypothetical protein